MRPRSSSSLSHRIVGTSLACLLGSIATGCAFVEETHPDGTIARSVVVGPAAMVLRPANDQGAVAKATGLGLAV